MMLFKKKPFFAMILALCMIVSFGVILTSANNKANNAQAMTNNINPQNTANNKPSLSLNINSAAVNVLPANENKISAEFNPDVYNVDIKNDEKNNSWQVAISCKTKTNTNTETIKLYLPDFDYSDINLSVDNGHITCDLIKSGHIKGEFNMASVFLTLPEGFAGSLNATANSGYFQLISKDDFQNSTTTITDAGKWGEIYHPQKFIKNNNTYTFTAGTGSNIINVTKTGSGVMGIYTSEITTFNLPDEWNELWQDYWQNENWEDD